MNVFSRIFLTGLAVVGVASSCDKDPNGGDGGKATAARIEAALSRHFSTDGATVAKVWNSTDLLSIVNTSKNETVVTGSPVSPGVASSTFVFSLKDAAQNDNLLGFFSDYDVKYSGGVITTTLPDKQDGTVHPLYLGKTTFSGSANKLSSMTMDNLFCTVYAKLEKGNYSIKKAVLSSNGGEKIAGQLTINPADFSVTASASSVTVDFSNALDCTVGKQTFPIIIAPVNLSKGYTITYTTDSGEEIVYKTEAATECKMAGKVDSAQSGSDKSTQLLFCGDNLIYLIDADLALAKGYKNAIIWEWDAKTEASNMGKSASDMIRLDDCKAVDNNTKILATSSKSYAVLLDKETKKLLWYSTNSKNAHSAEILPNNRVAVACSEGGDIIQIFDIDKSNRELFSTPLAYAHGVVWNPANQRLYACGNTTLNEYSLVDWETSSPKLKLEKTINTSSSVTGLHDLMLIDGNTLLVAGKRAALYDIATGKFNNLPIFASSTALKSVNYNPETGECWFTDATGSDRELTWSSNDIRYTNNVNGTEYQKSIMVGGDFNMYKVRVFNW